jgi:hypothetical protein
MENVAFGTRARRARPSGLSGVDTDIRLRELLPAAHRHGYATISRLERGLIDEEKADVVFLAGLAKTYGVPLDEISPSAARSARRIISLLEEVAGNARTDDPPTGTADALHDIAQAINDGSVREEIDEALNWDPELAV